MTNVSINGSSSQDLYNIWQQKLNEKQAKNEELKAKETQLTTAKSDVETKTTEQVKAQESVTAANQRVTEMVSNYNVVLQRWNIASSQVTTLAAKCAQDPENESLKSQYERAKANLETLKKELENSEKNVQIAKDEQDKAEKGLEIADKKLNDAATKVSDIEKEISEIKTDIQTLETEAGKTRAEYEAAKAEETKAAEEATKTEMPEALTEEEAIAQGYTIIKTAEDLAKIGENLSGKYILMGDIDLSDIEWSPIGDEENPFTGVLNGNGYSIQNLTLNVDDGVETENVGFFGVTQDATISNIIFENAVINTPEDYNKGSVGILAGTAKGTSFENITVSGDITAHQKAGGLVGTVADFATMLDDGTYELHNSSFKNITSDVNINSSYYAGGIAGYIESTYTNDLVFENCHATGNIVVKEKCAGGLIGEAGETIITINNCTSSVNLTCDNADNVNELTWLQETARVGGFIGCANGTKIAICNSEYTGIITAEGEFQGEYYGYYMNDAHVTIFELSAGLPVDDILNIDGVDALTPKINPQTGEATYEVTVSTMTGMDKIVALIRNNPALAEIITFNINFDFETMDAEYTHSNYDQYGVVQHLYEETDENGNTQVVNHTYIDNEIDVESTFHYNNSPGTNSNTEIKFIPYKKTMIPGLWKDDKGRYYVERHGEFIRTTLQFFFEHQRTSVATRLEQDEVRFRERITDMVHYYQEQIYAALLEQLGLPADTLISKIDEPEYKYLKERLENGESLTAEEQLALMVYEYDYKVCELVAETTHNEGCGMGGNASFLEETTGIPLKDEDGRIRYTTLNGLELRQRLDEEGNLVFDDDGDPVYEHLDGSDYLGLEDVYTVRGYPVTDEDGNFLYTDEEGKTLTENKDESGNVSYTYEDGTLFEGDPETLTQQLEEYDITEEYNSLKDQMKGLLDEAAGKDAPAKDSAAPQESSLDTELGDLNSPQEDEKPLEE